MVVCELPKLETRVRFSYPAPSFAKRRMPTVADEFWQKNNSLPARFATDGRPSSAKVGCYNYAMRWFVYILQNERGRQYVGYTSDMNARLKEHNEGSVKATKGLRPWHVQWFCCFREKGHAIAFEKYLKSGSGTTFRRNHLVLDTLP